MTNLERAIKDGYAHIIGEKGKEKISRLPIMILMKFSGLSVSIGKAY